MLGLASSLDSILLLLCGYVGDDVLCRNPQNVLDVNCGPWSDHIMISGAPERQKAFLGVVMSLGEVVLWPL